MLPAVINSAFKTEDISGGMIVSVSLEAAKGAIVLHNTFPLPLPLAKALNRPNLA
jgi:hypothetical protein